MPTLSSHPGPERADGSPESAMEQRGVIRHRCAVLGKPIAHSLSPVLHEAAYRELGLSDWSYERVEISSDGLQRFLASRDATWVGLSLTMPLKREIVHLGVLSDVWSKALRIANTAVLGPAGSGDTDRTIRLYNTDVDGIVRAFDHATSVTPTHGTATILGSGNTALSAVAACSQMPGISTIVIAARHPDHAAHIEHFVHERLPEVTLEVGSLDHAAQALRQSDVAISTLPAHAADTMARDIAASGDAVHGTLLDVAYAPRTSLLCDVWSTLGGISITGDEMLLYQAIDQVRVMTDGYAGPFDPDTLESTMRQALQEAMR